MMVKWSSRAASVVTISAGPSSSRRRRASCRRRRDRAALSEGERQDGAAAWCGDWSVAATRQPFWRKANASGVVCTKEPLKSGGRPLAGGMMARRSWWVWVWASILMKKSARRHRRARPAPGAKAVEAHLISVECKAGWMAIACRAATERDYGHELLRAPHDGRIFWPGPRRRRAWAVYGALFAGERRPAAAWRFAGPAAGGRPRARVKAWRCFAPSHGRRPP